MAFLKRLRKKQIWERILRERLSEPLHINIMSAAVALFGSHRAKTYFDLIIRPHHAYGLLKAADDAKSLGINCVTALEFGVANGAGLLNICRIADKITAETGVKFKVFGFDSGAGMPPPRDYRDHPEYYRPGDFPMQQPDKLRNLLPPYADLVIGDVSQTVPEFVKTIGEDAPLGFVSLDVDYYWSAVEALRICDGQPTQYLPMTSFYLDDIVYSGHNSWCGELAAVADFNTAHAMRKIERSNLLRTQRLFKNARWIDQMFTLHVLDHPWRSPTNQGKPAQVVLDNPYF